MDTGCQDFGHTKSNQHCAGIVVFLYRVMRWQFNLKKKLLKSQTENQFNGNLTAFT